MANNCLQTKLKSEVVNDNLLKLNEFFINITPQTITSANLQQCINFAFTGSAPATSKLIFTVVGDGYIADTLAGLDNHQKTLEVNKDGYVHSLYCSNIAGKLKVSNKYGDVLGTIFKIMGNNVAPARNIFSVNLEDLRFLTSLESCWVFHSDSYGDISVLGGMTRCTNFEFTNAYKVTGTIESFVQAQRAAGRTSTTNTITFRAYNTAVTFDGEVPESANLSWTASTITVGDKTINA